VCPHCEMNMTIPAPEEPEKAAAAEPRRRIRFGLKDYKLQVAILGVGNRPFVIKPDSLVLENLSVDGIMFCIVAKGSESRPRLKIGGRVQVKIETPAFEGPIEMEAGVKRVEPIPDGRVGTVVGAKFLSYRGDARQKLERLEASPSLRKRAGQPEPVGAPFPHLGVGAGQRVLPMQMPHDGGRLHARFLGKRFQALHVFVVVRPVQFDAVEAGVFRQFEAVALRQRAGQRAEADSFFHGRVLVSGSGIDFSFPESAPLVTGAGNIPVLYYSELARLRNRFSLRRFDIRSFVPAPFQVDWRTRRAPPAPPDRNV